MPHSLVVDDSKVVRTVCKRIMEALGFTVSEAENGSLALDECAKQQPAVILLDWNMPVMDGLEFIKAFRKLPNNEKTMVIFCTTENDIAKIQTALSEGANEYVMKPFDQDIISGKLTQLGLL